MSGTTNQPAYLHVSAGMLMITPWILIEELTAQEMRVSEAIWSVVAEEYLGGAEALAATLHCSRYSALE